MMSQGNAEVFDGRQPTKRPATSDVVLDISDLRSGYRDVPVLRGVTLQLREGEAVGIVGHNGMGKTTLLRTCMGLCRRPADGSRSTASTSPTGPRTSGAD